MAILGKSIEMKILDSSSPATDIISGLCVHEIGDLSATAGEIDATCHGSSNVRKKIRGVIDLGSITVTVDYKDAETSQDLWDEFTNGTSRTPVLPSTLIVAYCRNIVRSLMFASSSSDTRHPVPSRAIISAAPRRSPALSAASRIATIWSVETMSVLNRFSFVRFRFILIGTSFLL